MKKLIFFFLVAMLVSEIAAAQKEFNNWFFGNNAGLNFNSGAPVSLGGGNIVSTAGSSSMSDENGNLLFYSDGNTVWNKNHQPMPNGTGLLGDLGGTQTVLITYYPGNKDLYFIFTSAKGGGPDGFRYSVINMQLNGGLGDVDVTQKNVGFNLPVTEKITAVKNKNGIDLWLIFHAYNSNAFFVYSINCKGKFFPHVSAVGSVINTPGNARGYLKASPDGKKLVSANFEGDFEMFDFDNATGLVSNFQAIPATLGNSCGPYGVEFSPDSKLLYLSESSSCAFPFPLYTVSQYKLDPNINNVISSRYFVDAGNTNLAGALQLGPDNKIYIAYNGASNLAVINNPNTALGGCNFQKTGPSIAPAISTLGLPGVVAGFKRNILAEDTTVCDGVPLVLKVSFQSATYIWNNNPADTKDSLLVTTSGKYWVDITSTDENNETCPVTDTINVSFQASPKFSLPNDTLLCENKLPLLIAPALPAGAYLWQDSTKTATYSVTAGGLYWLQVTANGCSTRDSITVTAPAPATFNLGADTTICAGDSLKLTVNVAATSYIWNTGSTANNIEAKTSGIYWCDARYANGCSYRDSINVTVTPLPAFTLGKDTTLCQDKFPLLLTQAVSNATYLWQDSSTANTYSITSAGTYWLKVTANGCSSRDSIIVQANPVPVFSLGSDTVVCTAGPYTLTVNQVSSIYLWSTGNTSNTINITASGIYWCQVTNSTGCSYRDSIQVTLKIPPIVNLGKDTVICQDKFPLVLNQSITGASYAWQDGSTGNIFSAPTAGIYWLDVTLAGCSSRDSIVITSNPAPSFTLGNDTTICSANPYTLTVNPAFSSYLWNTGSTAKNINVTSSGIYWCQVTNSSGCSFRDSIQLTITAPPVVNLGRDTSLCPNQFPYLISQAPITGASYLWKDGSTGNSLSASVAGIYWLQATLNGCTSRDSIFVQASPVTTFSLGADTTICTADPYTLTVNTAFSTYLWNTGSTARSITITSSGLYWCEVSGGNGCSARDSIQVTLTVPPVVNLGKDTSLCSNQFPYLISQAPIAGANYLWKDGSTGNTISASTAGTYWLQATLNGCTSRDSLIIQASPVTTFSLGGDTTICTAVPYVLTVNPAFSTYLWNNGSTSRNITITSSGLYWCEVSNGTGCSARDSIQITLKNAPVVNLGNDTTICQGQFPLLLSQSIPGATFLWQDGTTGSSLSAATAGSYWLQASINGCTSRDSIAITSNPVASFTLGSDTTLCAGTTLALTVNPAFASYLWSTGSNARSINVTSGGTYWCEAKNSSGCSYRDSIVVTLKSSPVVNLGNDTTVCSNAFPVTIGHVIAGVSYLWQDGTTNPTYNATTAGTYSVQVTANGCSSKDTITITASTPGAFTLGPDVAVCSSDPIIIKANVTASNYLWSNGNTTQSISVNTSGDYWCEINRGTGCSFRDSVHIELTAPIIFSLGRDTVICDNRTLLFDVSNKGDSYLWQDNSKQPQYPVTKSGTYYVAITKGACVSADTVVVTYSDQVIPRLGPDKTICPGEEIVLDANVSSNAYLWQDGSTGRTFKVTSPGTYSVQVISACGRSTDEIIISTGFCSLMIPNAFTPGKSPNGIFKVLNATNVKDFNLQVFGRWGQRVFQTSKPSEGWDGKYNGVEQPAGTYVFMVSYTDQVSGKKFSQKGTVILVR